MCVRAYVCMCVRLCRAEVFIPLPGKFLVSLVPPWLSIICLLSLCPGTRPCASLKRSGGELHLKMMGTGEPQVTLLSLNPPVGRDAEILQSESMELDLGWWGRGELRT